MQNFKVQLDPFAMECEKTGIVDFVWTQGTVPAKPPPGFEDYFGPGPLFRFVEFDGIEGFEDIVEKIRDFPDGITAEDTMRRLFGSQSAASTERKLCKALDHLFDVINTDPEIEVRGLLTTKERNQKADLSIDRAFLVTPKAPPPRPASS